MSKYKDENIEDGVWAKFSALRELVLNINPGLAPRNCSLSKALSGLTRLEFEKNKLTTLGNGVFSNLDGLRILNMNMNILKSLGPEAFSPGPGLERLTCLQLGDNHLDSERIANETFKSLVSLSVLSAGNQNGEKLNVSTAAAWGLSESALEKVMDRSAPTC